MSERIANMYESSWPFILQTRCAREFMNGEKRRRSRESMNMRDTWNKSRYSLRLELTVSSKSGYVVENSNSFRYGRGASRLRQSSRKSQ